MIKLILLFITHRTLLKPLI